MPKKTPMSQFDRALCERIFFSLPGFSDKKIGSIFNLKRQTIQGWRSGKSRPTLDQISTLTVYTKIDWNWYTTGKTTSATSVVNAYFPVNYEANIIKDPRFYELARIIALKLLQSNDSKLFLHNLGVIYEIALDRAKDLTKEEKERLLGEPVSAYSLKKSISPETKVLIDKIYTQMKLALTIQDTNNNSLFEKIDKFELNINKENKKENKSVEAYTDLAAVQGKEVRKTKIISNQQITILGNAMSPIINHQQKIITGSIIRDNELSVLKNKLAIIVLNQGYSVNVTSFIPLNICKKISYISTSKFIITSQDDCIAPQIITMSEIDAIWSIAAILY